jgi:hypothetical protein
VPRPSTKAAERAYREADAKAARWVAQASLSEWELRRLLRVYRAINYPEAARACAEVMRGRGISEG